jgi:PKD domain
MRRLVFLVLALSLLPTAAARAAWQPAQPLEGPDALVAGLGGVAVARDGTGGLVFLRHDGVFVSRLSGGAFGPPAAVGSPGSEAKLAAGDGGELAVAWISGGTVLATVAPDAATGFGAPVAVGGPGAENLDVDLGVNGVAYAVWEQGGDVRAARLQGTTWAPLGSPLDLVPGDEAGTGALRPRVAVDAAGNALVVWGEREADGLTHVIARRLIGTALSAYPQDAGGDADSPDVSTEYDGNFEWVVYRQGPHTYARHFLGSTFDPPVQLDAGVPSDTPRVSLDGGGDGAAVFHAAGDAIMGAALAKSAFGAPQRLGSGAAPDVSATDNGNVAAAWLGGGQAHGAFLAPGKPFQADTPLSNPALGAVNDLQLAGDRVGDYAVVFTQGPAGARALSVAVYDRPPGRPSVPSSTANARSARPLLRWTAGLDLWGPQTFQVVVDGKVVGTTAAQTFVPPAPLRSGRHTYRVVAVDRVGQTTPSHTRSLRIDGLAPRVSVSVSGRRVRVRAHDRGGSGLARMTVSFGDHRSARGADVSHVYARGGRYRLRATAVDRAGNVARRTVRLRVR